MTPTQPHLARDLLHAPTSLADSEVAAVRAEHPLYFDERVAGGREHGPQTPRRRRRSTVWLGPDEWLVIGSQDTEFARYLSAWLSDAALEYRTLRPGGTGL